jgi:hypothetical protein
MSRRLFIVKEWGYYREVLDNGLPGGDGMGVILYNSIQDATRVYLTGDMFNGRFDATRAKRPYVAFEIEVDGLEARPFFPIPGDTDFMAWGMSDAIGPERIIDAYRFGSPV